jgi:hypothetical protein
MGRFLDGQPRETGFSSLVGGDRARVFFDKGIFLRLRIGERGETVAMERQSGWDTIQERANTFESMHSG